MIRVGRSQWEEPYLESGKAGGVGRHPKRPTWVVFTKLVADVLHTTQLNWMSLHICVCVHVYKCMIVCNCACM